MNVSVCHNIPCITATETVKDHSRLKNPRTADQGMKAEYCILQFQTAGTTIMPGFRKGSLPLVLDPLIHIDVMNGDICLLTMYLDVRTCIQLWWMQSIFLLDNFQNPSLTFHLIKVVSLIKEEIAFSTQHLNPCFCLSWEDSVNKTNQDTRKC